MRIVDLTPISDLLLTADVRGPAMPSRYDEGAFSTSTRADREDILHEDVKRYCPRHAESLPPLWARQQSLPHTQY